MSGALPLSGIVAVELGASVAGPWCGMVLAELGAEVLKIENPENGDDTRAWAPPYLDKASAIFQALNRNKKSAAVDLKDADQLAALKTYIETRADVVLQNMRPGLVARFGLDAASLRAAKPSLIYANLSAYGTTGPLKDQPGYDPLMQAFAGIMSVTGHEGAEPARVGPSLVDGGTGMWAAIGILAALHRRTETGEGATVDASLMETAVGWMNMHIANYVGSGKVPVRMGSENFGISPYKAYVCGDGEWLVIAAGNNALFKRLADAVGHSEWVDDPDFASNPDRVAHRDKVNELLGAVVASEPRNHWNRILDEAGVPNAPVQSVDQLLDHPQMQASGMLQAPPEGTSPTIGLPISFDGQRPPYRSVSPDLGADTADVIKPAKAQSPAE